MGDFNFRDIFTKIVEYFKGLSKGQIIRLAVLGVVAVAIVVTLVVVMNHTTYAVLYPNLSASEAGEVMSRLREMGVDARADGSAIKVPADMEAELRMQMAAEGYPKSGLNYDIFQSASGLGTTDMERNVNLQYQLQENLRQAICTMDKVNDAVVLITMPKENTFVLNRDKTDATAAITLKLNETLTAKEADTIYELVSTSVPNLPLENIRLADTAMNAYTYSDGQSDVLDVSDRMQMQIALQNRLEEQVKNLLAPVFGDVAVAVNAVLDFDKKVTEEVEFAPPVEGMEEGLVVSAELLYERVNGGTEGDLVGFDPNGNLSQYQEIYDDQDGWYLKHTRSLNYELNELRTQIEHAQGSIKDLSIAVLLNEREDGEDFTDGVVNLVTKAIGVQEQHVSVETMRFGGAGDTDVWGEQQSLMDAAQRAQLIRLLIIIGAIIAVLVLVFAMIRTLLPKRAAQTDDGVEELPLDGEEGMEFLADEELMPDQVEELPAIRAVEDANLTQLEEYIDKSPEAVAQLLRNWLSE